MSTVSTVLRPPSHPHTSSHTFRNTIDTRDEITLWDLLIWSYKNQMVRFSGPVDYGNEAPNHSMTSVVCNRLMQGEYQRTHSHITGQPAAHEDAEQVHDVVMKLKSKNYWMIVHPAEKAIIPDKNTNLPLGKLRPDLKTNGQPKYINSLITKRPIACKLIVEGYSWQEREDLQTEARKNYAHWYKLLTYLYEEISYQNKLSKWKLTTVGVDPKPWVKTLHKAA